MNDANLPAMVELANKFLELIVVLDTHLHGSAMLGVYMALAILALYIMRKRR